MEKRENKLNVVLFIVVVLLVTIIGCTVMVTTGSSEMTVKDSPSVVSDIKDEIHLDIGGREVKEKDSVETDSIN